MAERQAGCHRSPPPASLIVNREPDGRHRVVGPRHAMTHMGADVNIAAGFKQKRLGLTFEKEAGRPGQDAHPLGPVLVIPLGKPARMTGPADSLNSDIAS